MSFQYCTGDVKHGSFGPTLGVDAHQLPVKVRLNRADIFRWQKCYKHWQHATKGSVGPFCLNTMGRRAYSRGPGPGAVPRLPLCRAWPIFLLAVFLGQHVAAQSDSLAAQQAAALYTLKTMIDPSNVLADWTLPASNACGFTGVTCNANSEVMSLNLAGKKLGTSLPQSSSDYSSLTTLILLDLSNNGFTGSVPPIGQLTSLQTLELEGNSFTGPLPQLAGFASLTVVNFQENQLTGTLPDSWSADTALQSIIVADNKITGSLPSSWSQLSSLVNLDLRSNDLSGPVPDSWRGSAAPGVLPTTGMKSLTTLAFGANQPLCSQGTGSFIPASTPSPSPAAAARPRRHRLPLHLRLSQEALLLALLLAPLLGNQAVPQLWPALHPLHMPLRL
ncbi:hypothetical protein WJX79_002758 [Trebouxia sp. C0005]